MTYGTGPGNREWPGTAVPAGPTFIARGTGDGVSAGLDGTYAILGLAILAVGLIAVGLRFLAPRGEMAGFPQQELAILLVISFPMLGRWWWRRHARKQLAETELWLSPYGAEYRCAAGHFEVPWSAVRLIGFDRWPGPAPTALLRVESFAWKGPVRTLSHRWFDMGWNFAPRALRLDLGRVDRAAVAQAAYAATGGQVRL